MTAGKGSSTPTTLNWVEENGCLDISDSNLPEEETLFTAFHDFLMFALQLMPLLAKSCVTVL